VLTAARLALAQARRAQQSVSRGPILSDAVEESLRASAGAAHGAHAAIKRARALHALDTPAVGADALPLQGPPKRIAECLSGLSCEEAEDVMRLAAARAQSFRGERFVGNPAEAEHLLLTNLERRMLRVFRLVGAADQKHIIADAKSWIRSLPPVEPGSPERSFEQRLPSNVVPLFYKTPPVNGWPP
jgi:hypothetical protein